tara:strand:+ start:231 stop:371 length:141 start_codon:yes stop_codon:yes gene_type:complete
LVAVGPVVELGQTLNLRGMEDQVAAAAAFHKTEQRQEVAHKEIQAG